MENQLELESSSDIEWMLQNDQVSDLELLANLMQDYFQVVLRLATAFCNNEEQGCIIAQRTLSNIVLNRQRYWGNQPFLHILLKQVYANCMDYQRDENRRNLPILGKVFGSIVRKNYIPACQPSINNPGIKAFHQEENPEISFRRIEEIQNAIHRLDNRYRIAMLLYCVTGMSAEGIAGTLNIEETEVLIRLKLAWEQVFADLVSSPLEPEEKEAAGSERITAASHNDENDSNQDNGKRDARTDKAQPVQILVWRIYIQRMIDLEKKWISWLDSLWLLPQGSLQKSISLHNDIASAINSGAARKHLAVVLKELAIGCIALFLTFLVVYVNRQQINQVQINNQALIQLAANARNPAVQSHSVTRPQVTNNSPGMVFQYISKVGDTLDILAQRLGVPVDELRDLNHLSTGDKVKFGQLLVLPASHQAVGFEIPTPVAHSPISELSPDNYSPDNLLNRLASSNETWNTLWADILSVDYGPLGYTGPPIDVVRKQVWISKPDSSLVVSGPPSGPPGNVRYIRNGKAYWENLINDSTIGGITPDLMDDPVVNALLFPYQNLNLASGDLRIQGFTQFNNTKVIVADWASNQSGQAYRFWIDPDRSIILRLQQFAGQDSRKVVWDISINQVHYDVEFPGDIFDLGVLPTRQFARDETGTPPVPGEEIDNLHIPMDASQLPMQPVQPPASFNPSHSRLSFAWPLIANNNYFSEYLPVPTPTFTNGVELFAGEYYLSTLDIGKIAQPYTLYSSFPVNIQFPSYGSPSEEHPLNDLVRNQPTFSCRRSGDGRYIAFHPYANQNEESLQLYWLDLFHPKELHSVSEQADSRMVSSSDDFRFSPDSHFLAYFNCETVQGETKCGLYLLNLLTGEKQFLFPLEYELDLTWSPDNRFLAMIGSDIFGGQANIEVISVSGGSLIYDRTFDWETRLIPADSPTQSWGTDFPAILNYTKEHYGTGITPVIGSGFPVPSDLQNCIEPPAH